MKIEKKHIIAIGLGVGVSVFAAFFYLQYKKLMEYCVSFGSVKINNVSLMSIDFDLFLNFKNRANADLTLKNQEYKIYLNDIYITTIQNTSPVILKANSLSPLAVNVKFLPTDFVKNMKGKWVELLSQGTDVKIKIHAKLGVKFMFLSLPVDYTYEAKLSDLAKPTTPPDSSAAKCV
jgi:LEA14-like dessication related protein